MQQKGQRIYPKIPDGPQRGGEQAEKQHAAPAGAQQGVEPELALGPAEGEEEHPAHRQQAVQGVQPARQPGPPQPQRPQPVIHQAAHQPQHDGLGKDPQLIGYRVFHRPLSRTAAGKARPAGRWGPHRTATRSAPLRGARPHPATAFRCADFPR